MCESGKEEKNESNIMREKKECIWVCVYIKKEKESKNGIQGKERETLSVSVCACKREVD